MKSSKFASENNKIILNHHCAFGPTEDTARLTFLEFYPQEKFSFLFSFEPIHIFLFSGKKKKQKTRLILFFSRPKTAEVGSAQNGIQPSLAPSRACSATQAATWAWAGKAPRPRAPPGPRCSPHGGDAGGGMKAQVGPCVRSHLCWDLGILGLEFGEISN